MDEPGSEGPPEQQPQDTVSLEATAETLPRDLTAPPPAEGVERLPAAAEPAPAPMVTPAAAVVAPPPEPAPVTTTSDPPAEDKNLIGAEPGLPGRPTRRLPLVDRQAPRGSGCLTGPDRPQGLSPVGSQRRPDRHWPTTTHRRQRTEPHRGRTGLPGRPTRRLPLVDPKRLLGRGCLTRPDRPPRSLASGISTMTGSALAVPISSWSARSSGCGERTPLAQAS